MTSHAIDPPTKNETLDTGAIAGMIIANKRVFRRQLIVAGSTVAIPIVGFIVGITLPFFMHVPWYFLLIWHE